jgi:hypothetical protein
LYCIVGIEGSELVELGLIWIAPFHQSLVSGGWRMVWQERDFLRSIF